MEASPGRALAGGSVGRLVTLLEDDPASLYAPEYPMPRAAEITLGSGVIVYDPYSWPSPKTRARS
ncbi:MAG: hypothetical protein M3248_05385 [Actinomycetota bacterium]|nr:hypothetical protein [Actinomycetota bacterium]